MIFGFAPASKDSSLTLKIVFSFGFSWDKSFSDDEEWYIAMSQLPPQAHQILPIHHWLQEFEQPQASQYQRCLDATGLQNK